MVAESGGRLLEPDAERALRERLVPRATVVTPNLMEAARAGRAGTADADPASSRGRCTRSGPRAVVVTGGHREAGGDLFYDGERLVEIPGERHPDGAAHGSGCTHSSVLAAQLALGLRAARGGPPRARDRRGRGGRAGCASSGAGPGPVDVLGVARAGGPPEPPRAPAGRARRASRIARGIIASRRRGRPPHHRHLRLEPRSNSSA